MTGDRRIAFARHGVVTAQTSDNGRACHGAAFGMVTTADEVRGFKFFDDRDLIGFVDGTGNPVGQDAIDASGGHNWPAIRKAAESGIRNMLAARMPPDTDRATLR